MKDSQSSRFRPFRVVEKLRESATITSFHLEPVDPGDWMPFEAGQFLILRVPEGAGHVLRNYTVSSAPQDAGRYRITVKREGAPRADVAEGLSSTWLHDRIQPGDEIEVQGPRGAFKLDGASQRPVLLISGGVGLTPMVSMLKVLAETSDRPVWFIHACDSHEVHALQAEVAALAARRSGIRVHYCYRNPTEADRAAGRHHSEGLLTRETLQALLPLDDYEAYLCGPPPFMQALYTLLTGLGLRKERIAYEFFGPASLLTEAPSTAPAPVAAPEASPAVGGAEEGPQVVLNRSGCSIPWREGAESLLSLLEDAGLEPEFSCRAGVCGTCVQSLVSGEVTYFEEPLDEPEPGKVLLCCCRPTSTVVLDL
ncbi:FAD-binding oxidoreductase [Paracoccus aminophilus]|uniref:nitric oxide dioxygenase n=1 Tax=Paracoccus aminophilus JCM 7686 TaxID=1367847 RepID=S5YCA7_PARAH|nr:FAD-binding oxidoreductase [Paracoccus aminophilus]AGT09053.1 phthalate 4,5-dioxygenase [Paracoccus aminophilus JCM 7686]